MNIEPPKDFIVGFGTGRCGTVSLSEHFNTWHEYKMLGNDYPNSLNLDKWFKQLMAASERFGKHPGDISLVHIKLLPIWLRHDVIRVVLMRDREEFVASLSNYRTNRIWKQEFPLHDFDTEDGISRFWDWYYSEIFKHEQDFVILNAHQLAIKKNEGKIWQTST